MMRKIRFIGSWLAAAAAALWLAAHITMLPQLLVSAVTLGLLIVLAAALWLISRW